MVVHWKKKGGPRARRDMMINGLGALATGLVAKFAKGAWIAVLAIPGLVLLMFAVHRHYGRIVREVKISSPAQLSGIYPPIVVVPIKRWTKIAAKALRFDYMLSQDVTVLHIDIPQTPGTNRDLDLKQGWEENSASSKGSGPDTSRTCSAPIASSFRYHLNRRIHPATSASSSKPSDLGGSAGVSRATVVLLTRSAIDLVKNHAPHHGKWPDCRDRCALVCRVLRTTRAAYALHFNQFENKCPNDAIQTYAKQIECGAARDTHRDTL